MLHDEMIQQTVQTRSHEVTVSRGQQKLRPLLT